MAKHRPKLLVVDDEPDQCESIRNYFSKRGFAVFTASSGSAALALIKENKPALVLLDLRLSGGMDGRGVLRSLRDSDKKTKVAVVTGDLLGEEEMREITALGIVDFLNKPVDFLSLEKVVIKILAGKYPKAARFEAIRQKDDSRQLSLRRISHDLSNVTTDIANKCELYILDTEEGLNKDKPEKELLNEALNILRYVLKSTERLNAIVKKIPSLIRGKPV